MSKKELSKFAEMTNIADELDDEELGHISSKITAGFEQDLNSMSEWLRNADECVKLASLVKEPKNSPFNNAANVKYPLITDACNQIAGNMYPEIVKDGKVAKATVLGTDFLNTKVDRANRVCDFMNYQLLFQSTAWEEGLDKLLHLLPNIGCLFKKTYYDPIKKENCSDVCDYKTIVLDAKAQSIKSLQRISHILYSSLNEVVVLERMGIYSSKAVTLIIEQRNEQDLQTPIELIEQHCYLDLDHDNYAEPYVVTLEKTTRNILRIKARYETDGIKENKKGVYCIDEDSYFTDFHFLPNPSGSFLSVGFGTLMMHLNMSVNTILNQLIDAGTLCNMQGGYIDSRIKLNTGSSKHSPGEWIRATPAMGQELAKAFLPITYKEPSNVLFQLLGTLIQAGKELSSSTDIQSGQVLPDNAKTGATNSILERGLKVFNSIQRRFYRSEKNELQKLFKLNRKYLDEQVYYTVLDDKKAVFQDDFNESDIDIMPVADPNMSSDSQRMSQMQVLQSLKTDPGANIKEINLRILQYARVQEPEKIFPPADPKAPPPPEVIKLQADITAKSKELQQKDVELQQSQEDLDLKSKKLEAEIAKIESETIKNIALAKQADANIQIQDIQTMLSGMKSQMDIIMQHKQMDHEKEIQSKDIEAQNAANQSGSAPDMGGAPTDPSIPV